MARSTFPALRCQVEVKNSTTSTARAYVGSHTHGRKIITDSRLQGLGLRLALISDSFSSSLIQDHKYQKMDPSASKAIIIGHTATPPALPHLSRAL